MNIPEDEIPARVARLLDDCGPELSEFARSLEAEHSPLVSNLAYLLRHRGPARGLAVDAEGWASLPEVVRSLRSMGRQLRGVGTREVEEVVRSQETERFEIRSGKIRALYGHTLPGVVAARPAAPPTRLFHGTAADTGPKIREVGLLAMRRGHVHLTSDLGYALQVARACGRSWIVLRVRAAQAAAAGVEFLTTAGHVWLASAIRPEFLDPLPVARG